MAASGRIVCMPGFVPTPLGEQVEEAIDILGSRMRVAIIGYLRSNGAAPRGDIAAALGMVPGSVSNQLAVLLDAGLMETSPPAGQIRPGNRVRYSIIGRRVDELYETLGVALGTHSQRP